MKQYDIYLAASCSCAGKSGYWVADTYCPAERWDIQLDGKAHCKDSTRLFFKAAIAALDDLLEKSEVVLHIPPGQALDLILGLVEGTDSRDQDLWEILAGECDRHKVSVVPILDKKCRKYREAMERLTALIEG